MTSPLVRRTGAQRPEDLSGKVAFVAGASRGIGATIAEALARKGASVAVAARTESVARMPGTIHAVADRIVAAGGHARAVRCDVTDEESVSKAVGQTVDAFGGIDILVANAGVLWPGPIESTPLKRWQLCLNVNLTGVFLVTRAVIPHVRARGGGSLIAITTTGVTMAGATNFPNPLMNVLTKIVTEDIPKQPDLAVKCSLLSNALANLDFPAAGKTTVNHLANEKDYEQTTGSPPKYFAEAFKNNHVTVQEIDPEKGRYDYLKGAEMWVDFAAINLGGGAFHNGFAQEETMTLEMPELANVVAEGGNFTRSKGCDPKNKKDGPLVCSPTPLFIGPVHRTIAIKPGLGGDAWKTTPVSKALRFITPLDKNLLK